MTQSLLRPIILIFMKTKGMKNLYLSAIILALTLSQSLQAGTYQEVVSILETNCTFSSCHDSTNPVSGLDFTASDSDIHSQLVNADPQNSVALAEGLKLVDPGYPQRSLLYQKINYGLHADSELATGMGDGMPTGGNAMSAKDIEMVRQWIYFGAKSNSDTDVNPSTLENYYNGDGLAPIVAPAPPAEDEGFQLHFGQIFLDPLEERELIYRHDLNNPEELEINRIEVMMNSESHHFLFFNFEEGSEENQDQGIIPITLFSSATGQAVAITSDTKMIGGWAYPGEYDLPAGTAFKWPANAVLKFNYHILNYSSTGVLPAEIYVNIYTQPAGTAVKEMYSDFFLDNPGNLVIPQGEHTFDWTFDFNNPNGDSIHVWTLGAHTHSLGTDFDMYAWSPVSGIGDQIYEGFYNFDYSVNQGFYDYAEPPFRIFDGFLSMSGNEGFQIEADYNNDTGNTVTFGLTTEDEMFGFFMQYIRGSTSELPSDPGTSVIETFSTNWNIQPNPAQDYVQISTDEPSEFSIFDAIGKVIFSSSEITNTYDLDTSNLKDGIYFVQLGTGDAVETKKLIISH